MKRMAIVRIGNAAHITWRIFNNNGSQYNLSGKIQRLWIVSASLEKEITSYNIQGRNELVFTIAAEDLTRYGAYKMVLSLRESESGTEDATYDLTQILQVVSESYPDPNGALTGVAEITFTSVLNNVVVDRIEGLSAYEIAVNHGFEGTEEEWLAYLKADVTAENIEAALGYKPAVETEVNEAIARKADLAWVTVDLSSLTLRPGYIRPNGVWYNRGAATETYRHALVPIESAGTVSLTTNANEGTYCAWLTSNKAAQGGVAAALVAGTSRFWVEPNTSVALTKPSAAKYLYVYAGQVPDLVSMPSGVSIAGTLQSINEDIEAMDSRLAVVETETACPDFYGSFDGADSTLVSDKRIKVVPGESYRLHVLSDVHVTSPTGSVWRLQINAYNGSDKIDSLVSVADNSALKDHYDFKIPANTDNILVSGRCASGETFVYIVERLTTELYNDGDILTLNPDSEFLPKMRAAMKPYWTSTSPHNNHPNCVRFLHLSDIHANWTNVKRFLRFYNHWVDKGYAFTAINTGDTVSDKFTDGYSGYTSIDGVGDILNVIGNHDTRGANGWQDNVGLPVYNAFIKDFVDGWDVSQPSGADTYGYCYYYKDYASNKLRLIVTDIMGYNDTQDAWLAGILTDAKAKGYHVLIATHFAAGRAPAEADQPSYENVDCQWSSLAGFSSDSTQYNGYNSQAYKMADTVHAFMENGGIFCGYLCGHVHKEYVARLVKYPDQMVYMATSSKSGKLSDCDHTTGTRMQDEFQIVAVDTFSKIVKIFKVGANYDRRGRHKDSVCVSYDTHEVVGFPVTAEGLAKEMDDKQDSLVSGQNIKTINGFSILGGGNLQLPGPVQSDWNEDDDGDDAYIKNKPTDLVHYDELSPTDPISAPNYATEEEVSQLRSEVDKVAIPITETGKIINTSGTIGSVVPAPQPVSGYRYMKFPVVEGDIVIVNAKGGSAPRAWAFVDSSDKLLSQAPYSAAIVSVTLTAPGNAAAVIINDSSDSTSYYISKSSILYRLSKIGASQTEENGLFKTTVVGGDGTSQDIVGKVSLATYYTPDASVTQIATYEGCIEEIWVDPNYLSPFNLKFASFKFYGIKAWLMAKTAKNLSPTWTATVDLREKTNGEIIPLTVSSSTIPGVPSGTVVGYVIFSDITTFQATPFDGTTAFLNLPRAISLDYNRLIWLNIMMTSASVDAKVLAAVTGGISPLIPSLIYATVGVQLNLYNDAVCLSMDRGLMSPMNYIVQWGCNKGMITDRCFRWTPTADEVGDTAITCSVYTPSGVLIQSASSIIRVKVASIESAKRVVFFGDSTGAGSAAALSADFDDAGLFSGTKPTMLGIRGTTTKYEAFGGARWADYATEGRAAYRCQVSGVGAIALNSQYTNNGFTWTVVEVNVTEGVGNILITKNDLYSSTDAPQTAGTLVPVGGGENVAYTGATKEAGNPLWHNNAIDFSHYRNTLGLGANEKIDLISFQLGLNGNEDNATLRQYIIDLYTAAVADNPNCIFLIGLVTGPCNTVDAYGVNYGAGNWMTTIRRYHAKRKVYEELAESGDYPNMRIATPNLNIDRYYGFPLGTRAVSARNNTQEQYHTNFVHPSESGYAQIGDAFFAAYIVTLNE